MIYICIKNITAGFLQSKAFQLAQLASWVPDNAPAMMPKTPAPKGPTMLAVAPMVTPGPSRMGNFHLGMVLSLIKRDQHMTQYQDVPSNLGDGLLWFTMVYYGLLVYGGLGFRVYQVTFQF